MEMFLVIWLLCACVTAVIMNGKTDSQAKIALYFVVGLIFGIFGILLAIAAPNEKIPAAAGPIAAPQVRQSCPFCRELILSGAIKCKHCGERLDSGHPRS